MTKPLVIFVGLTDWANSTYEAVRAINHVGEIEARHIVFWEHPWHYPTDILCNILGKPIRFSETPQYEQITELFEKADLVHLWNCEFPVFYNQGVRSKQFAEPVRLPVHKIKSSTFAGSAFRKHHERVTNRLEATGVRCIVEDPCFHWQHEKTEFIPHAIDTESLTPAPYDERNGNSIGCYNPDRDYYDRDIALLQEAIDSNANGCYLTMKRKPIPWVEHLAEMRLCWWYYQNMDDCLGTFGRSALEACSMGVPTFSFISEKARDHRERGGFHDPECGIINITPETLQEQLGRAIRGELGSYPKLAERSRSWVQRHYSYDVVGRMYTDMFKEILK